MCENNNSNADGCGGDCCHTKQNKKVIMTALVNTNEGYYVDSTNNFEAIRVFEVVDGEEVGFEITSVDPECYEHKFLRGLLGRRIKITIEEEGVQ